MEFATKTLWESHHSWQGKKKKKFPTWRFLYVFFFTFRFVPNPAALTGVRFFKKETYNRTRLSSNFSLPWLLLENLFRSPRAQKREKEREKERVEDGFCNFGEKELFRVSWRGLAAFACRELNDVLFEYEGPLCLLYLVKVESLCILWSLKAQVPQTVRWVFDRQPSHRTDILYSKDSFELNLNALTLIFSVHICGFVFKPPSINPHLQGKVFLNPINVCVESIEFRFCWTLRSPGHSIFQYSHRLVSILFSFYFNLS